MPFRDLAGHRRLATLLSRAIARESLPPALLLAGPAGVGKRRTAQAIAETLNCLKPAAGQPFGKEQPRQGVAVDRDACGECAACRRIARGVHPDVIVLTPGDTGTIKIEPVRDVIDRTGYRPFEGRRRVVIIDEADALVLPAQHALLKTLEEPPPSSTFILVSSMPDALLPTVLSRCSRLRFGPLSAGEVAGALMSVHGWSESDARAAAAEAAGSIGRAVALQSVDLAEAREAAQRLLEQAARTPDLSRRLDAVKDLTSKKGSSAGEREQLAGCLRALASLLRDVGILASAGNQAPNTSQLLANTDLQGPLARLASAYDPRRSAAAYAAVDQALAALERNASPKVVADWLVLQL